MNGQEDDNDYTTDRSSKADNDDIERLKKELVANQHEEGTGNNAQKSAATSPAIVCNVPTAIRMNSGCLEVRGGMICEISNKVEKMIVKVFFKCSQCGTFLSTC